MLAQPPKKKLPTIFHPRAEPTADGVRVKRSWNVGISAEKLLGATVHELIDGVSVYVRNGVWLCKGPSGLMLIPLSRAGRPFFQALLNWLDGLGPVGGEPTDELPEGDYELVSPDTQGNPYGSSLDLFASHTIEFPEDRLPTLTAEDSAEVWFREYFKLLNSAKFEGLVWRDAEGPFATLRRTDFGLPWPVPEA